MASYPTSVWDGTSPNRTAEQSKAPDWRDWNRIIGEVAAAQTRINANNAGRDGTTRNAPGTITSKSGLTLVEKGNGAIHKTVFTFDEMEMASVPGSTQNSDGDWGTQKLYTFPIGHISYLGSHCQFPVAGLEAVTGGGGGFSDTADFEIGVGSVASAQEAVWGLGNGTQEDIVTALDVDLTSKTSNAIESAATGTVVVFDGTTGAETLNLNFRGLAEADHGAVADVLKVSGILTVLWSCLGDD